MKFFDPLNSLDDNNVFISLEDNEEDDQTDTVPPGQDSSDSPLVDVSAPIPKDNTPILNDKDHQRGFPVQDNGRITRSRTKTLPKPIERFSSSSTNIQPQWSHVPWISQELNIILHSEGSTVGQNFPSY